MNKNPLHRATPRHYAIFGLFLLFLIASLTGSVHLFAVGAIGALFIFPSDARGASDRHVPAKGAEQWR